MSTLYPSILDLPQLPQPSDGVYTRTLTEQRATEAAIERTLEGVNESFAPRSYLTLEKGEHVRFLANKFNRLPPGFVSLDSSRPWLVYWLVQSLDILGIPLGPVDKQRAVSTLLAFQHPKGGFCGGSSNSQNAHLLPNYAAVCALAQSGNAEPGGGWDGLAAARQDMYDFFMRCKQPDGSFVVCEDGEVDVRGTYVLFVVATLLDIITPELLHNVDKFIAGCQTYEGGFACSSYAYGIPDGTVRSAFSEAHGGYTSCSVFTHFMISSVVPPDRKLESLDPTFPVPIDVENAIRWSVLMQCDAGDAGGFRGRTNKLVDGCYGWWVAGGFPVLEELNHRKNGHADEVKADTAGEGDHKEDDEDQWVDESSARHLFNRVALQDYILLAAQDPAGGLRDKPGKGADLYHTCNNLCGLSVAQHCMKHSAAKIEENRKSFDMSKGLPPVKPKSPNGGWKTEEERQLARREAFANVLGWMPDTSEVRIVGPKENRVNATTPVINLIRGRLEPFVKYMYGQT